MLYIGYLIILDGQSIAPALDLTTSLRGDLKYTTMHQQQFQPTNTQENLNIQPSKNLGKWNLTIPLPPPCLLDEGTRGGGDTQEEQSGGINLHNKAFFFLIKKASSQVPGVTVDQVRSKIQISAKPG